MLGRQSSESDYNQNQKGSREKTDCGVISVRRDELVECLLIKANHIRPRLGRDFCPFLKTISSNL